MNPTIKKIIALKKRFLKLSRYGVISIDGDSAHFYHKECINVLFGMPDMTFKTTEHNDQGILRSSFIYKNVEFFALKMIDEQEVHYEVVEGYGNTQVIEEIVLVVRRFQQLYKEVIHFSFNSDSTEESAGRCYTYINHEMLVGMPVKVTDFLDRSDPKEWGPGMHYEIRAKVGEEMFISIVTPEELQFFRSQCARAIHRGEE